jgi:hypothetical protein
MKDLSGFTGPNGQTDSKYIDGTSIKCSCTGSNYTGSNYTGSNYIGGSETNNSYGFSGSNYQFGPYGVNNKTFFLGNSGSSYYFSDGSGSQLVNSGSKLINSGSKLINSDSQLINSDSQNSGFQLTDSSSYLIDSSNNVFADQVVESNNNQYTIGYGNKYIYKNSGDINNSYHKKISVSKEIANYFNLSHTTCNFNDLVYAILNKSKENKVNTNSIQSVHFSKESTICLDGYGKKLFKIKCNFIEINCLIDFIVQQKTSDYFYYENEQKPVHVNSLY